MVDPMPVLRSSWRNGADFLTSFRALRDAPARFFLPYDHEPPDISVGTLVSAIVRFDDREAEFHLHARVLDRRDGAVKRGFTLETLAEERDRVELLLIAARGESLAYRRRRHPRRPVDWPCHVRGVRGQEITAHLTNVNVGGCHIACQPDYQVDECVSLLIDLPGGAPWRLTGRVAERIEAGPQRGIGVEFLYASASERDRVHAALLVDDDE